TPSIISVDDNQEILVGQIAKERLMTHPQLTAATFKRFMGTEKIYKMGTYSFTPVELSTLLLKKLKQNAERTLNEECRHAIISVPAYFNNVQRAATIEAANLAGLEVNHLISEPTAAAMAYGIHRLEEDSRILVIDLGGGTFDVSLLEMFEGIMQVEAIAGDNRLGGEDFTYAVLKDCLAENKLDQQVLPAEIEASLYKKIEMIKKELSPTTPQQFEFILDEKEYTYQLTEERFRSICQPLLAKLRAPIIRVLNDSGIKLDEIDRIILIGGATKSTTIRSFVSKLLGKLPFTQ
ncbi:MAG: Hsp70 family protein, partial [Erysipelotrichaceae bacterium]